MRVRSQYASMNPFTPVTHCECGARRRTDGAEQTVPNTLLILHVPCSVEMAGLSTFVAILPLSLATPTDKYPAGFVWRDHPSKAKARVISLDEKLAQPPSKMDWRGTRVAPSMCFPILGGTCAARSFQTVKLSKFHTFKLLNFQSLTSW